MKALLVIVSSFIVTSTCSLRDTGGNVSSALLAGPMRIAPGMSHSIGGGEKHDL